MEIFGKKTFCVITGASRGLGRCLAMHLAPKFAEASVLVLLSRDVKGLEQTKAMVCEKEPAIKVCVRLFDQGNPEQKCFDDLMRILLEDAECKPSDFAEAIIIHNAGTIDTTKYLVDIDNVTDVSSYMNINIVGFTVLNSKFLQTFPAEVVKNRVVINITSLAAQQPFKTFSLYSAAKAARDILCCSLAHEDPSIRVLNYAPGPLDTDMVRSIQDECVDADVRQYCSDPDNLLTCDQTCAKFIAILEKNAFQNGAHVDYYDEL